MPTSTTEVTTTTEPLVCRNSFDPRCGAFYWDPQPANQPLTLDVQLSSTTVHSGEPITVTFHSVDPDAQVFECPHPTYQIDTARMATVACDPGPHPYGCDPLDPPSATGPWDPPDPAPLSDVTQTTKVTFNVDPGTVRLYVRGSSGPDVPVAEGCPVPNPYASSSLQVFDITVT